MEKPGPNSLRVGVIGLGGMGKRWAQVADEHPASTLVAVCNPNAEKTDAFATQFACDGLTDWRAILDRGDVNAVVVATPHVLLTEISHAALESGKHVFCEKPGGISSSAIDDGVRIAERRGLRYRVNFNIRLHPAVALAKEKADGGAIGDLMFLKAIYGHAAREGYEHEWWCDKAISGGGELIDQGSHIIDLANWFLGPFISQAIVLETAFWPIAPLEDNAFLLLRNAQGKVAQLHASWTHWKKTFRLEVYGETGYLVVDGLGGQYGLERLVHGQRAFGRDAPRERSWEFPSEAGKPDAALNNSWEEFVQSVRQGRDIGPSATDAVAALKIIEAGYRAPNG
jgi:predicted dehydrogenase